MSQFTKPDFLKAGPVMTDATSRIDTDILEPVVQSDTFMRFQFQNKGVLNAGSRVTFSITKPDTEAYFPIGVGVGALIERATFKIGGKTICEVQDWGHYHGYESVFLDQSVIKEREQFLSGRALSMGVSYQDGQSVETDRIFLENGKEKIVNVTTATNTQLLMLDLLKLNSEPVFSVRLDDLVPCLKGQELPLFNLMEDVQLELTLTEPAKRVCIASGGDDTKAFSVNTAETRLIADYTFLDGEEMEAYRKSEQGYSYTFLEPRLTKTTLADASAWGNQIRNVGGAGRNVVRAVVSITSEKVNASGPIKTALGDYRSIAPESSAKGTYGKLTSNFKKNCILSIGLTLLFIFTGLWTRKEVLLILLALCMHVRDTLLLIRSSRDTLSEERPRMNYRVRSSILDTALMTGRELIVVVLNFILKSIL
mgnify:CR=1 FL=1